MAATISFTIVNGLPSYTYELRTTSNVLVDSGSAAVAGTYYFYNVPDGTYNIVTYDSNGDYIVSPAIVACSPTTTTTTVAPTTTTTTTAGPPPPLQIDFGFLNANVNYFISSDNGITWNEDLTNYGGLQPALVYQNLMLNSSTFLVGATKFTSPAYASVLYTTNGGSTWSIGAGFTGTTTNKFMVSGSLGQNIYSVERTNTLIADRVWKSTNNGANWTRTTLFDNIFTKTGSSERDLTTLVSNQNKIVVISTRSEILRSLDGGVTWSNVTPAFMTLLNAASVTSRYQVNSFGDTIMMAINNYITSATDIYRSIDFGTTWTLLNSFSGNYSSASFINQNTGIIVNLTLSNVIYSNDGFVTSTNKAVTNVSPNTYNYSGKPFILNINEFWLISREPIVNKLAIWRTTNGGNTFTKTILTQDGFDSNINFTVI